jgi:hypothetical protein
MIPPSKKIGYALQAAGLKNGVKRYEPSLRIANWNAFARTGDQIFTILISDPASTIVR